MFENKEILILGMARSGYEAAKYLSKYKNHIVVTDTKEQEEEKKEELKNLGVTVVITENQEDLVQGNLDYMIKNPGIKYDNPCVLKAKKLGIPVINELELAYHFLNKDVKIIGVTGSNGKTTTVTLIYRILKEVGFPVYLGGNIGTPLTQFVDEIEKNAILVLEISDHQLCDMYDFKTDISVLTNIYSEVHIDFHDSFERYVEMKKRIFNHHTKENIAILNKENQYSIDLVPNISSKKFYFSKKEADADIFIKENAIYNQQGKIIDIESILLKGEHNLENSMAAILVAKQFSVSNTIIQKILTTFPGVEHRIEFVKSKEGVAYYNDSKSTNNKATEIALRSFATPVLLIMGGLNRNLPFDELKDSMEYVKEVLCYGETKDQIKDFCMQNGIKCFVFENLEEATKKASSDAEVGDTVLLSPACASWDQYKNFEERGEEFKKMVNAL